MSRRKRKPAAPHSAASRPSSERPAASRPASQRPAQRPTPAAATSVGAPVAETVLLALLVLLPIGFSRWTEDAWDFPKGTFLLTGALLLAAWGLAG